MKRTRVGEDGIGPEMRIGIVGAGASGLTAAHSLAERGYHNVVILEKEAQVGGKCLSVTVGNRVYELGAVLGAPSYSSIRALARSVDLESARQPSNHFYTPDGRRTNLYGWRELPRLLWELIARYGRYTHGRYAGATEPGLDQLPADLYLDFETFANRRGIGRLAQVLQPVVTGFGYGYADEVPAAYLLKYLDWATVVACARQQGLIYWPQGIQTLWRRLAEEHEVVLEVEIERVRRGETVEVETNVGRFTFDALLLACPLDNALQFLDATPEEQALLARIRTFDYWTLLCAVDGLPRDTGFIPAHFAAEKRGHVMVWYSRWPDDNLYTLYLLSDCASTQEMIEARVTADLARLGANLRQVNLARRWRYFPHVTPTDMAAGFYQRLEALQGTRRTFYAGEIMSFATLECCARYAQALVGRFFPAD